MDQGISECGCGTPVLRPDRVLYIRDGFQEKDLFVTTTPGRGNDRLRVQADPFEISNAVRNAAVEKGQLILRDSVFNVQLGVQNHSLKIQFLRLTLIRRHVPVDVAFDDPPGHLVYDRIPQRFQFVYERGFS